MSNTKTIIKSASDCNLLSLKDTNVHKRKWKKGQGTKLALKKVSSSKLSYAMEKSMTQDLDDPAETKNTSICSDDGFTCSLSMIPLTIYLVIGNVAQPHSFLIGSTTMISNLIAKAINEYNTHFASDKTLFRLNTDASLYALKPSKKNGFPKSDMPFINPAGSLSEMNMTQFTLVWKENSSDYRSYFIKNKVPEKKTCQGCIVF